MAETTDWNTDEQNEAATIDTDLELSSDSRRQRDGTGNTGAFGQRTGHSDLIFLEGILPKSDGDVMNDNSIEEQMSACLDRLDSMLGRRASLADVMKVEIQLTDPATASTVDEVYETWFDGIELPPRTVIGVCALPGDADVQLDVIAADE